MVSGQWSVVKGGTGVVSGQWSVVRGGNGVVSCQWYVAGRFYASASLLGLVLLITDHWPLTTFLCRFVQHG